MDCTVDLLLVFVWDETASGTARSSTENGRMVEQLDEFFFFNSNIEISVQSFQAYKWQLCIFVVKNNFILQDRAESHFQASWLSDCDCQDNNTLEGSITESIGHIG